MIAPPRLQHVSAGGLALLMHGLLLLALMIGVSWKNPPQLPIEAEMWIDLPDLQPSIPAAEFAPMPEQLPAPEPAPEALPQPKAEPKPPLATPPKPLPAQPDQAQIALEKAEKKRAEEKRRADEVQLELQKKQELKLAEEKRVEAMRKAELERVEAARLETMRVEATRIEKRRQEMLLAEQEKREQSRRLIDQELARQMRDELAAESSQLNAMQSRSRVSGQARMVLDSQERIRAKIRDALILPKSLKGDAEVIFQVSLLPNGEVVRVTLIKTSGQPLYDGAVERAIFKSSPLPLPSDRQAAQQFRDGLTLKFRPSEDADKFN
jgi:colicin import membrane protein